MNKDQPRDKSRVRPVAKTSFGPHLLTELRVANFKALANEQIIPLAPLTLVYGPNAAGKSSIIQSLLLLAQSVQANQFLPKGPLVDLRDFTQVVTGHDRQSELTIGIRFVIEEEDTDAVMLASLAEDGRDVLPIRVPGGVTLSFYEIENVLLPASRASLAIGDATLVEPDPITVEEGFDEETGPWGPTVLRWKLNLSDNGVIGSLVHALGKLQSLDREVQSSIAVLQFAAELIRNGHAASATLECWVDPEDFKSGLHAPSHLGLTLEPAARPTSNAETISTNGHQFSQDHAVDAQRLVDQWTTAEAKPFHFRGLSPIARLFGRVEEEARGLFQSDLLPRDPAPAAERSRERRKWDHRPDPKLVSLGPIRPAPRRVHLEDEPSDSEALAMIGRLYRSEGLLRDVNGWLHRLEIPYSVEVDQLVSRRSGAERGYSFELTDSRTNVEVSLADVGYGVSQILPIVTECAGAENSIICIEQPELHLHPRLAANLSELLVEAAVRGNQIIAETHSENILLRVQRLIRDGKISSSDVAVLYVDNTQEDGATVRRLRLDDEGDLLDRWPGGFFDDRLADVLGIGAAE